MDQAEAKELVRQIDEDAEDLSPWEIDFIAAMLSWRGDYTEPQLAKIVEIATDAGL
jgi:hypothetical protein